MVPALSVGRSNEHFERSIARSRAHPGEAGVNPHGPFLSSNDRIRDTERQVVVGMHAALGFRLEHAVVGPQPFAHTVHVKRAAAVGHINAVRAVAFHQQGLLGQRLGVDHVAHHQKARYIHAQIAGDTDMLLGNVCLGAMGRDPHRANTQCVSAAKLFDSADARHQQRGQHRPFDHVGCRLDPFPVGVRAKAIIE